MRAAYLALILGLAGGLGLATVVLSGVHATPLTVAAALGLPQDAGLEGRRSAAVAALTARCMRSLGFDWQGFPEADPSIPDASLDPVRWADRWGFGISTMLEQPVPAPLPDPDLEALARLPAAQQAAMRAALHGSAQRPGCAETATAEVYGLRERAMAPLRGALETLAAEIAADPAASSALEAWAACVAPVSAGRPADRASLAAELSRRFAERLEGSRDDPSGLAAVQRDERSTAGVLARCDMVLADARTAIAAPHEAGFVGRHRMELETIGAAIRAAEAAWPTLLPSPLPSAR